jgi:hypothetical protein
VSGLAWNWLCLPYLACALLMIACGVIAAVIRGDRVLRLGAIGAATTALPWALCSGASTWSQDPELVTRLLRLGNGPVALVGPSLMLVLLGASGQLERNRWIARAAALGGLVMLALCWTTDLVVAGVHLLPSGTYYTSAGPLTGLHFSSIGIWLATGIVIARRTTGGRERRRLVHMLVAVLVLGTIGATDLLLVYDIAGVFPIAWLPAGLAAGLAVYYELTTDLLRPQGIDRGVVIELAAFVGAVLALAVMMLAIEGAAPVAAATLGSVVWTIALGIAWTRTQGGPVRIASERSFEEMAASLAEVSDERTIAERLAALWQQIGIRVRGLERVEDDQLVAVHGDDTRAIDPDVAAWLVRHGDALAAGDLGTMVLGAIRPRLEHLVTARGATLIVPLIDRGTLVGVVEADHAAALREGERGLVVESARAAARALTFVALARAADRERETAREVEVAEAMRLQAAASRDDELGRWAVAAEYRTAPRTTGAGWSATLLADGRLAVMVTEAQAHGVAAALATAALTGAFAAATTVEDASITLDDLLDSLRASAEGVVRGGEPVAAFLAIIDGEARTISWACAGHPGAAIVGPVGGAESTPVEILGGGGARLGASLVAATRGTTRLPHGALLAVASSALRSDDDTFTSLLRLSALAGVRLANVLVEHALTQGQPAEDLLAVVVREHVDRPRPRSQPA